MPEKWAAFKSRFFAVFVASFGADALLTGLLMAMLAISQANAQAAACLEHPFAGLGGTLAALGCILAVLLTGRAQVGAVRENRAQAGEVP